MQLVLHLNARFQPKHRFELEDALQEILQKNQAGEITGGGTSLNAQCHRYSEGISLTRSRAAGSSFLEMKEKMNPFVSSYPLCQKCHIEQIA